MMGWMILLLTAANTAMSALALLVFLRRLEYLRREAAAETAMEAKAEEAAPGSIDEGFENLMKFSVSLGHGRMTGGEP